MSQENGVISALELWRSLREYLKVEVDVDAPSDPEPESQVKVKVTATNTAPSGQDWPEVVFIGVQLKSEETGRRAWQNLKSQRSDPNPSRPRTIGFGPESNNAEPMLASGEYIVWEFECAFRQLPEAQPTVEAYVAWDALFRTVKEVTLPTTYTQPTMLNYVRAFNETAFWNAFTPQLGDIHAPSPETPFAEIQGLTKSLSDSIASIEEVRQGLSKASAAGSGEAAKVHFRAAGEYMVKQLYLRQELKDAIASAEPGNITETIDSLKDLDSFASELHQAEQDLVRKYNIPEDDARIFAGP